MTVGPDILRLIFWIGVVIAVVAGMFLLAHILGPKKPDPIKLSPYECGLPPFHDARGRTSVRFYTLAVLFLIFDVDVALLYPWAIIHRKLGFLGLVEAGLFILVLLALYVYAWQKRALEFERPERKVEKKGLSGAG